MVRDRQEADTEAVSWTDEEEDRLSNHIECGADTDTIYSDFPDRTEASLDNKIRRLKKENGLYNSKYAEQKYALNERWVSEADDELHYRLKVFDAYAGTGESSSIYEPYAKKLVCCEMADDVFDKLESRNLDATLVNGDCIDEMRLQAVGDETYNYIDLDPFGTPFYAIQHAIPLIRNGYLSVTYGDINLHHWGRTNALCRQYKMPQGVDRDRTIEHMIGWTIFEGIRGRDASTVKKLSPVEVNELGGKTGVVRVLYRVEKTGVLSDTLKWFKRNTVDTGEALPNRPWKHF